MVMLIPLGCATVLFLMALSVAVSSTAFTTHAAEYQLATIGAAYFMVMAWLVSAAPSSTTWVLALGIAMLALLVATSLVRLAVARLFRMRYRRGGPAGSSG